MAKLGIKNALAYRFDFFITIFTTPISLIVYYFLWKSIFEYSGQAVIRGFTFEAMVAYYVINMIVAFVTWTNVERWIEYDVVHGDMIINLLRPMNFLHLTYFYDFGLKLFILLSEGIPIYIFGLIFFGLELPTLANFLFFMISLALASLIFFLVSYIIGIAAFWMQRIGGLSRAKKPLITFLGGGLLPLSFFPEKVQILLYFLPFQYVRYIPISIYLGAFSFAHSLALILVQILWVVLLYALALALWKWGFKKFAGAGV